MLDLLYDALVEYKIDAEMRRPPAQGSKVESDCTITDNYSAQTVDLTTTEDTSLASIDKGSDAPSFSHLHLHDKLKPKALFKDVRIQDVIGTAVCPPMPLKNKAASTTQSLSEFEGKKILVEVYKKEDVEQMFESDKKTALPKKTRSRLWSSLSRLFRTKKSPSTFKEAIHELEKESFTLPRIISNPFLILRQKGSFTLQHVRSMMRLVKGKKSHETDEEAMERLGLQPEDLQESVEDFIKSCPIPEVSKLVDKATSAQSFSHLNIKEKLVPKALFEDVKVQDVIGTAVCPPMLINRPRFGSTSRFFPKRKRDRFWIRVYKREDVEGPNKFYRDLLNSAEKITGVRSEATRVPVHLQLKKI